MLVLLHDYSDFMTVQPARTDLTYEQRAFQEAPFVIESQLQQYDWIYHDVCPDDKERHPIQIFFWNENSSQFRCYDLINNQRFWLEARNFREHPTAYRQMPTELVPYAKAYSEMRLYADVPASDALLHDKGRAMIRERFDALSTILGGCTNIPMTRCVLVAEYEQDCHPPLAFVKQQTIGLCERCGPAELESPPAPT